MFRPALPLVLIVASFLLISVNSQLPWDTIPDSIELNMETIVASNKTIRYSKVWWEYSRKIARVDHFPWAPGYPPSFLADTPLTEIFDYNKGIWYAKDRSYEGGGDGIYCDADSFEGPTVGSPFELVYRELQSVYMGIEGKYVDRGTENIRSGQVPAKRWSALINQTQWDFYLSLNDWDVGVPKSIVDRDFPEPLALRIRKPNDGEVLYDLNFNDFEGRQASMKSFDVADCYYDMFKINVMITFLTNTSLDGQLTPHEGDKIAELLSKRLGVSILRFSNNRLYDDLDQLVYFTTTLLDDYTSVSGVTPTGRKSGANRSKQFRDIVNRNRKRRRSSKFAPVYIGTDELFNKLANLVMDGGISYNLTRDPKIKIVSNNIHKRIYRGGAGGGDPDMTNNPYMKAFSKDANRVIYLKGDKEVLGVSREECARRCLLEYSFKCESFDYCPFISRCLLSRVHSSAGKEGGNYRNHSYCDHYSRSYINSHYTKSPGTILLIKSDKRIPDQTAEDCAAKCTNEDSFKCESFDFCPKVNKGRTGQCLLSKLHKDSSGAKIVNSTTCDHYSSSVVGKFKQRVNTQIKGEDMLLFRTPPEDCAKLCVQESTFECRTFSSCQLPGMFSCALHREGLQDIPGDRLIQSPLCTLYERLETQMAAPIKGKQFGSGSMAGLGIGMIILGLILGAVVAVGIMFYRYKSQGGADDVVNFVKQMK